MSDLRGSLIGIHIVSGELSNISGNELSGQLSSLYTNLIGNLSAMSMISGEISSLDYPTYSGENVVYPKAFRDTILETSGHKLNNDIVVKEVPYFETSNQNGTTVYIAKE